MKGISHATTIDQEGRSTFERHSIRTTCSEGWSNEGDDMISAGKNEVANQPLVSVDDEVSAEVFVSSHELCRKQV